MIQAGVAVSGASALNLNLPASTTTLTGTIVDAAAGLPIALANVSVTDAAGHPLANLATQSNGTFTITSAVGSNLTLSVFAQGYAIGTVTKINLTAGAGTVNPAQCRCKQCRWPIRRRLFKFRTPARCRFGSPRDCSIPQHNLGWGGACPDCGSASHHRPSTGYRYAQPFECPPCAALFARPTWYRNTLLREISARDNAGLACADGRQTAPRRAVKRSHLRDARSGCAVRSRR